MKKAVGILLGVLTISILATGCGKKSEELEQVIEEQEIVGQQEEAKEDENVYENKDYAFTFTAPEEWKGRFEVIESKSDVLPQAKTQVDFVFAPTSKNIKSSDSVLTVFVLDKADWEELSKNENEPPVGELIEEKDDLVYIYQTPQSNPYGAETEEGKGFDEMYKALNIKENFKLNK